jgi:uncharacterized protein
MDKKNLAGEIKQFLNTHMNNQVVDVVVFGSQVRGTARYDSDYDVLVVISCPDNYLTRKSIYELSFEIDLKYNIFLDIQIISENDLKHDIRGKHPVIEDAIREGVHA